MDRLEILKKAKEKVDALVAERNREESSDTLDEKATEMALEMQKHDALISAIEQNYISPEDMARAFSDAINQIEVKVPEISVPEVKIPPIEVPKTEVKVTIPEIKLPTINVPEPKVTVNVPKADAPIVNVDAPVVNFPDSMDVGLDRFTKETPLPVLNVDPEGNYVSPTVGGGGGPRIVKATLLDSQASIGSVKIEANDSASVDAFARLRVSNPQTIFDSKQLYDKQPLFWDDSMVSGAGTTTVHSTSTASTLMQTTSLTAGKHVRQTFMRFNYQPGKSQLIFCTGTFKSGTGTGIKMAYGYFDDNNGFFFQNNEGTIQLVKRSYVTGSAVDVAVNQSNWNLDPMDGSGPSGYTMDFSKSQILIIDFEWLGVGRARLGFVLDGIPYYCHQFEHANITQGVYMSTPNLPLRYEISNDGNGGVGVLEHICSTVMSEGGVQNLGILRHKDSGAVSSLAAATSYVIMGGRLKSTHQSLSINIENLSIIGSANDQAHWELRIGGTVGAALTYSDITDSGVQIAIGSASHTITGGLDIDGGYFTTNQGAQFTVPNAARLGAKIDGTSQEWYLVVTPITNNITVRASMTWRELL